MAIFQKLNSDGKTVVVVTHEEEIARYATRIVRFKDGKLLSDTPVTNRLNADEELANMPKEED